MGVVVDDELELELDEPLGRYRYDEPEEDEPPKPPTRPPVDCASAGDARARSASVDARRSRTREVDHGHEAGGNRGVVLGGHASARRAELASPCVCLRHPCIAGEPRLVRPLLFALVIALVAGVLGAYGFRRTRFARAVPVELANAALEREVQVARALGFGEASPPETRPLIGSDYGSSNVRLDALELAAGECVAVVAATHGWGRLSWFRLSRSCPTSWVYRDPNDLSVQQNVRGVVAHVQFCAWEPTHVELCASGFRMRDEPEHSQQPSTITYRVLRASEEAIGGAARLDRGTVTRPPPPPPPILPVPVEL